MIEALKRVTQIPELRNKIVFTLIMLALCRVGVFIPVPGINGELAVSFFKQMAGGGQNLFQMVDMFSGGAFSQMTVTALAVVPYISASIILQMLTALLPGLQREMRENPEQGRRKVNRWTRILTLGLAGMQSAMFAKYAMQLNISHPGIVNSELIEITAFGVPWLFYLVMVCAMTTGTLLLMWIGEQITERGIGNGISLIITIGILSQLPSAIGLIIQPYGNFCRSLGGYYRNHTRTTQDSFAICTSCGWTSRVARWLGLYPSKGKLCGCYSRDLC
jgi:preprotein translocase subunit SecY